MTKAIVILAFSLLVLDQASAQQLSGYVSDAQSGERLAGAGIYSLSDHSGTGSNAYGYYNLKLKNSGQLIVVSMLGYKPDTLHLKNSRDTILNLKLFAKSSNLAEVTISSNSAGNTDVSRINKATLTSAEIKALPRFAGEVDVVKALQLLPGVRAGKEGSSDFQVRGGGPDQNLILLDGVQVYNSAHSLGLFSVFNADAIKNVELSKGGFPSRYGGRLSSVLDIKLKDGNSDHFRYDMSVGLISSKLMLEGPLKNKNTTFMIGARRTYLDIIGALAQTSAEEKTNYNFYDLNAKITHRFSEKDRLYFSIYSGKDALSERYESNINKEEKDNHFLNWGNITSALRYNHLFNKSLFGNLTLTYTDYSFKFINDYKSPDTRSSYKLSYLSKIGDGGLKMDFDYMPSNNHFIRFGANMTRHDFRPNVTSVKNIENNQGLTDTTYNNNNIKAVGYFLYAEDEIKLNDRLQMNAGLHFSGFNVQQKNYLSLQPRLSLNWMLTNTDALRASYAQMSQYIHLLSTTGSGSPADIWVPSTKKTAPQSSWQSTIGFAKTLKAGRYELNLDGFYKQMNHMIEYSQGASFLNDDPESGLIDESSSGWENNISTGKGTAYGAEFLFRKKEGKTSGWLGYTLCWSNRDFKGINNNKVYPYTYDSRHNLTFVVNHNLSKGIRLSGTWIFNSGLPVTIPLSQYKYYGESGTLSSIEHVNVRNNYRMRSYNRLDLGISFIKKKKMGERSWNISVYNAYNRKNPYFIQIGQSSSGGKASLHQYSLLPILPSFSYSYSFR